MSIVAAFLKRNGQTLRPMFAGVAVAVLLSVAVGVGLDLLATSLPQAQQEMMETVINAVAVVFVTSMIIWMNRNAAQLKGELEREARQAVHRGGALALGAMAFLAVLKEGFETSVFLLAAAETSHGSRWFAVLGGVLGIATSIGLGVGLYFGGLRLNLGRFFRVTGVFLVLIAAGLVLGALRTAHEAGWLNIGQRQLFDLSGWIPSDSVLGAVTTGVLGIPADPVWSRCWAGCCTPCRCSSCSCGRPGWRPPRAPEAGCWRPPPRCCWPSPPCSRSRRPPGTRSTPRAPAPSPTAPATPPRCRWRPGHTGAN